VPILFLWANSHGGFIAGWCLLTAYLGCRAFETFALQGRKALPLCLRLGAMSLAAGLATLINPYGPSLHLKLFKKLSTPRPEISEWHPPQLFDAVLSPWWLLLAVIVAALLLSRRQRDFTHLVVLALTAWQALEHLRHIPFVALTAAIFLPPHLESALRRLRLVKPESSLAGDISPRWKPWLVGGAAVALLLVGVKLLGRLSDLPIERSRWPVSAFQWMADQDLKGRLVVRFEWAQYAIMAFGAEQEDEGVLVAFDGRFRTCYPQEVIDMLFDFQLGPQAPHFRYRSPKSGPINPTRVLEVGEPDLALIGRRQKDSIHALSAHGGWTLLYQDRTAQLWGRSSKYDDPASPDYLSPERRRITDEPQLGSVTWPALPKRRAAAKPLAVNTKSEI
jgi:hypothetical protein